MNTKSELLELFYKSKKKSLKWQKYFPVYECLLSKYKNKKITFVEVGILNGGSLEIWKEYLDIGWKNGIEQADTIYSENLAKLKRDYEGMILYRKLLAMHMVTPPYVAETDLGVTGDRNHLNIGDKVLRISALPGLNVDSHTWKAFIVEE